MARQDVSMTQPHRPRRDSWTVSLHADETTERALGSGVVIDETRVLTCHHVVARRESVWVAFPKAGVPRALRVKVVSIRSAADGTDVAVLDLEAAVPEQVTPAPLRCPDGPDLVDEPWWAFGFPEEVPLGLGSEAHGTVGATLGYGWVRLDTESRYLVKKGFSGTGLWSSRYEAIVGLIGQTKAGGERSGDALALTLHQVDRELPGEKLAVLAAWSVAAAGETALAAWGWSLETDEEAVRHWRPRARGVSVDSERGYRFRGRRAALTAVKEWLVRSRPDDHVLVVTGSPGVGKSAVLGRVVTTADAGIRATLPAEDDGVRAEVGSVACAVHVKGKTALDVAVEIARAAAVRLPQRVKDLEPALRKRLRKRPGVRLNLVIDALDEASSPAEARQIIEEIVLPIVRECGRDGAQIVIGTRPADNGGELLELFGPARTVIDLDTAAYFEVADLVAYATATLQLSGAERIGNPYAEEAVAEPVAARIAQLAGQNFLVAGLVARRHGLHDTHPVELSSVSFPPDVDAALAAYLKPLAPVRSVPPGLVLTALAYGQAPGLSIELWRMFLAALGVRVESDDLVAFARSSAANFLVEMSTEGTTKRFRLFHQALNDALLRQRGRTEKNQAKEDQTAIVRALVTHGRAVGWASVDSYLRRSLPGHAEAAGLLDELLLDGDYLLHADLIRLGSVAADAVTPEGLARARLLRLTPHAVTAEPAERAAMLRVAGLLENSDVTGITADGLPYRAMWAEVERRLEWAVLESQANFAPTVCELTVDGRSLVAAPGLNGLLHVWDPDNGQRQFTIESPDGFWWNVCAATVDGRPVLVCGGLDGLIRLWDVRTGRPTRTLTGHTDAVISMCTSAVADRVFLAAGSHNGRLLIWDLTDDTEARELTRDSSTTAPSICAVDAGGRTLLAAPLDNGTIGLWDTVTGVLMLQLGEASRTARRILSIRTAEGVVLLAALHGAEVSLWNPVTGRPHQVTGRGPGRYWTALDRIEVDGKDLLVTAHNGELQLWDPATGETERSISTGDLRLRSLCATRVRGRPALAAAGDDGAVHVWALEAERPAPATNPRQTRVDAVCAVATGDRTLVAVASDEHGLRMYEPGTGQHVEYPDFLSARALVAATVGGRTVLAVSHDDFVLRMWDPGNGRLLPTPLGATNRADLLSPVHHAGRSMLVSSDGDSIKLWDLDAGGRRRLGPLRSLLLRRFFRRSNSIVAMCAITVDGRTLMATELMQDVRLWDLRTGFQRHRFTGHTGWVTALCGITAEQPVVASADREGTVRLWDPRTGRLLHELRGHTDVVSALCTITVGGRTMLASAGADRTVRLWDVDSGTPYLTIPVHHSAESCAAVDDLLVVRFKAGLLALRIH